MSLVTDRRPDGPVSVASTLHRFEPKTVDHPDVAPVVSDTNGNVVAAPSMSDADKIDAIFATRINGNRDHVATRKGEAGSLTTAGDDVGEESVAPAEEAAAAAGDDE